MILFLAAFSGAASSDEPLLLELRDRHPDADIWPRHIECGEDCMIAVGGPFKTGRWRITDLKCAEERESEKSPELAYCRQYFNWALSGLMHPKYGFEWLTDEFEPSDETESLVFVGDVSRLFHTDGDTTLYLIQRNIFRPVYHLVESRARKELVTRLKEYSLDCEGAGEETWERSGYRHHKGSYDIFVIDYCEIRDLDGFRNLGRKALKRPPSAIWERIGDPPGEAESANGKPPGDRVGGKKVRPD